MRKFLIIIAILFGSFAANAQLDAKARNVRVRDSLIISYDDANKYIFPTAKGSTNQVICVAASGELLKFEGLDTLIMNDSTLLSALIQHFLNDSSFIYGLAHDSTFIAELTADSTFLSSLVTQLLSDSSFIYGLAHDSTFIAELTADSTFVSSLVTQLLSDSSFIYGLAHDSTFIAQLTADSTFLASLDTITYFYQGTVDLDSLLLNDSLWLAYIDSLINLAGVPVNADNWIRNQLADTTAPLLQAARAAISGPLLIAGTTQSKYLNVGTGAGGNLNVNGTANFHASVSVSPANLANPDMLGRLPYFLPYTGHPIYRGYTIVLDTIAGSGSAMQLYFRPIDSVGISRDSLYFSVCNGCTPDTGWMLSGDTIIIDTAGRYSCAGGSYDPATGELIICDDTVTINFQGYWTKTTGTTTNIFPTDLAYRVGIGTATPRSEFEVTGNSYFNGAIHSEGGSGDADGSGYTNALDALYIQYYLKGTIPWNNNLFKGDMDGSGTLSFHDANVISDLFLLTYPTVDSAHKQARRLAGSMMYPVRKQGQSIIPSALWIGQNTSAVGLTNADSIPSTTGRNVLLVNKPAGDNDYSKAFAVKLDGKIGIGLDNPTTKIGIKGLAALASDTALVTNPTTGEIGYSTSISGGGGDFSSPLTSDTIAVINPTTGEIGYNIEQGQLLDIANGVTDASNAWLILTTPSDNGTAIGGTADGWGQLIERAGMRPVIQWNGDTHEKSIILGESVTEDIMTLEIYGLQTLNSDTGLVINPNTGETGYKIFSVSMPRYLIIDTTLRNYGIGKGTLISKTTGYENIAVGDSALKSTTTNFYNVAIGSKAGYKTTGNSTVFVGTSAGYNNTANDNIYIGTSAGYTNATGTRNIIIGQDAGYYQTASDNLIAGYRAGGYGKGSTGAITQSTILGTYAGYKLGGAACQNNVMTGFNSGYESVNVQGNAFYGAYSGWKNTTNYNTFYGAYSGRENTSGTSNVAIGEGAFTSNQTGSENTFVGRQSGGASGSNYNASYNTGFGFQNLYALQTGEHNTAIGYKALYSTTTGTRNTALGRGAAQSTTQGGYNTVIGYNAMYSNVTGNYNIAIGNGAGYYNTLSNRLFIHSGNTGGFENDTSESLIYGVFDDETQNQKLQINGKLISAEGIYSNKGYNCESGNYNGWYTYNSYGSYNDAETMGFEYYVEFDEGDTSMLYQIESINAGIYIYDTIDNGNKIFFDADLIEIQNDAQINDNLTVDKIITTAGIKTQSLYANIVISDSLENYTIQSDDYQIIKLLNNTGQSDTVFLPKASDNEGRIIKIATSRYTSDGSSGGIVLTAYSTDTVQDDTDFFTFSKHLVATFRYLDIMCDGEKWIITGGYY